MTAVRIFYPVKKFLATVMKTFSYSKVIVTMTLLSGNKTLQ